MEKKFTPSLQSSSLQSSSASSSSMQASSLSIQASSSSSGGPLAIAKSNAPKFVPKIPVKKEVVAVTSGVENSR
jgi:hypothetical protein